MVSGPGGARPAQLTQGDVDALVRGAHDGEAARMLRVPRDDAPTDAARTSAAASAPVDLSASEVAALARTGSAPARVAKRIAAATGPVRRKAAARGAGKQSAPKKRPPGT